jgi:four helix bundle protein
VDGGGLNSANFAMGVSALTCFLFGGGNMQTLDHERLEVYQVARQLSRDVNRLILKARRRRERGDLRDQVLRATAAIPLNIAEGAGEQALGRKAYFYRIASGSATELSAALDHMVDVEMLEENDTTAAKTFIVRIVSMLFKLTKSANAPESYPPLPRRRMSAVRRTNDRPRKR